MKKLLLLLCVPMIGFGQNWNQLGQDIDGEAFDDHSGYALSISSDGSIVAIRAYANDDAGTDAGHVRIYENTNGVWSQLGNDIDGESADDNSGESVSMNGDGTIVAIGATGDDGGNNPGMFQQIGHVRVYQYNGRRT